MGCFIAAGQAVDLNTHKKKKKKREKVECNNGKRKRFC